MNAAQTEAEIEALRTPVNRGTPYGTETWKTQIAATLALKFTLKPRGRPRKQLELRSTQTKKVRVPTDEAVGLMRGLERGAADWGAMVSM